MGFSEKILLLHKKSLESELATIKRRTKIGYALSQNEVELKLNDVKSALAKITTTENVLDIKRVSGSCAEHAIMHYDTLIKKELYKTFEPLRDHGTHADFCDKINTVREKAKDNYR